MVRKIHVIFKKEDINPRLLPGKTVVVFDVLLATSVICALLAAGAKKIFPVINDREALRKASRRPDKSYQLVGESNGLPIKDFLLPSPSLLTPTAKGKSYILSTTNGTVALRGAAGAATIYASSLLNNRAMAKELCDDNQDVVFICAGSSGQFCLEDLVGCGHLIDHLTRLGDFTLTDAALGAWKLYEGNNANIDTLLKQTAVGKMMMRHGLEADIDFITAMDSSEVVPILSQNGWITNKGGR
ncbi:2-phosphosulfolactate phosphatase [Salirhabdus euzebyi]|uniref:Probable 2-phosphosulfolactate phosphatase n=1 Tax=Salirhabdus euzebyi TaxID=394506 RepID=A0A841Q4H3_9BACI|nr:2-phosphosulfolactate phosphatase [Salirhabdus euzebyi]MBB6453263.1 2-phosphosulfolactate phosphatase [Salirhabdus euzebyi]